VNMFPFGHIPVLMTPDANTSRSALNGSRAKFSRQKRKILFWRWIGEVSEISAAPEERVTRSVDEAVAPFEC
jgi:hypothetical protein